jgi:N-acetylmuramoyl-L-alanine amidase
MTTPTRNGRALMGGDLQHRVRHLDDSPHRSVREHPPTLCVWHADASDSEQGTVSWLRAPRSKVSYHYLIGRDGMIYRLVPPDFVAWHAGDSAWPPRTAGPHQGTTVNPESIGVAFSNVNDGRELLTTRQLESALYLARVFWKQYRITPSAHVAHREVSPKRKTDPHPDALDMTWFRGAIRDVIGVGAVAA